MGFARAGPLGVHVHHARVRGCGRDHHAASDGMPATRAASDLIRPRLRWRCRVLLITRTRHSARAGQCRAAGQGRAVQCSSRTFAQALLGEVAGGCGCTPRGGSRAFPECTLALTAWCSGLANPRGTACRVDKGRVDSAHLQPGRHGAQRSGCRSGQQRQPVIAEGRLGTGPREPASPSRPAMRAGSVCARPLLLARARTAP